MGYLSKRIESISFSPTLGITDLSRRMREEGQPVISLSAGEPDFHTPQRVKDAAVYALQENFTYYTPTPGMIELLDAIRERMRKDQGLSYNRDEVMTTNGGKQALYQAFQALCNPGDQVLIPLPYWVSYPEQVKMAGGVPQFVETNPENSFKMTPDDLALAITERSRVLLLNNPQNPTGHLYTREELEELLPLIKEQGLFVVSDEIYAQMVYEGQAVSIASLDGEMKERTLVINGLSKSHAMTGWRVGYALGPKDLISAMSRLQSHLTNNINSMSQKAAVEALVGPWDAVEEMVAEFKARRDFMVSAIEELPYIHCTKPLGAFYLWVHVQELIHRSNGVIRDDQQLGEDILKKALLATVPGSVFGVEGYLRLSYATSRENLFEAVKRLQAYVKGV